MRLDLLSAEHPPRHGPFGPPYQKVHSYLLSSAVLSQYLQVYCHNRVQVKTYQCPWIPTLVVVTIPVETDNGMAEAAHDAELYSLPLLLPPPLPTHQSSTLCTLLCHAPLKSSRYRSHSIPWNSFIRTTAACPSCSFTCCSLLAQGNGCLQLFICRVITLNKYGFGLSIQQLRHEVSQ